MNLNISINSSLPADTNVIMGFVGDTNLYFEISEFNIEQQNIINNFITLVGKHITIRIINYDINDYFETNIVLPNNDCDVNIVEIDYLSLDSNGRLVVDGYVNMIKVLTLLPQ